MRTLYINIAAIIISLTFVTFVYASDETGPEYHLNNSAPILLAASIIKNESGYTIIRDEPTKAEQERAPETSGGNTPSKHENKDASSPPLNIGPPIVIKEPVQPSEKTVKELTRDYIGVSAGLLLSKNSTITDRSGTPADASYNNGLTLSGYVGHKFGSRFRLEGEVIYDKVRFDNINILGHVNKLNSDIWSIGLFTNGYCDFYFSKNFMPYVVFGLGFKSITMSSADVNGAKVWNKDHDTVFAYQLGVGDGIRITNDITLDVSYRYFDTSNVKIDNINTNLSNHNVLIGMRYAF